MIGKKKLSEIDGQIKALQDKKKKLEEKHQLQLAQLLKKSGASELPSDVLVGALLDAVKAFAEKKGTLKQWQESGKEFLNAGKGEGAKKDKSSFLSSENPAPKN